MPHPFQPLTTLFDANPRLLAITFRYRSPGQRDGVVRKITALATDGLPMSLNALKTKSNTPLQEHLKDWLYHLLHQAVPLWTHDLGSKGTGVVTRHGPRLKLDHTAFRIESMSTRVEYPSVA